MRRLVGVALLAIAAGGCTSVKMVQRDGCWVRRSESSFGRVLEEVGPCGRPQPTWSQDRLTRLVQECVAQADWRWQSRALETWSRRLPYPTPQPRQEELLEACMKEVRSGLALESDAATLKQRIAELSGERDALRGDAARERARTEDRDEKLADWLGKSHDRMTEWLGQAAQKPPGNATASATSTSNSDGKASTDSGTTLAAESGGAPPAGAPVSNASVIVPGAAAVQPGPASPSPAPAAAAPAAEKPVEAALPKRTRSARARRRSAVVHAAAPSCAPQADAAAPCAAQAKETQAPAR